MQDELKTDSAEEEQKPTDIITPTNNRPEVEQQAGNNRVQENDQSSQANTTTRVNLGASKQPWYKRMLTNKKVVIPLAAVVILALLLIVPQTRYPIFGLFWKQNYTVTVLDGQTNQPVSSAKVSLDGKTTTTDNHGTAHLKVSVGYRTLMITKNYYTTLTSNVLVPLRSQGNNTRLRLHATGRQVPVTIVNKVNGLPVENATIKAASTEAKTNKNGQVTIVLPTDKTTLAATITASGYNAFAATVQITAQAVPANTFKLTPAGKIYFLSNLSGKIDVVKTNLDGSDRQTVLAGTGYEDPNNTVMLASTDWKYLALLTVRSSNSKPELELIDTSTDTLSNIDSGDATFNLVGWDGDNFVYQATRNSVQTWQSNQQSLKSFNAATKKLTSLDSTTASGTGQGDYIAEEFGTIAILNDQEIVYAMNWSSGYNVSNLPGKSATLNTVKPDGSDKKVIKSFGIPNGTQAGYLSVDVQNYEPDGLYAYSSVYNANQVYKYEAGQLSPTNDVDSSTFYSKAYNYYLVSPSDTQAFWSEARDGKNTLFVGDQNGDNGKQIATLSDYDVYGWYSDNYLLVFKNSSELYIMPVTGGNPIKITDYYKPAQRFDAYGGR